MQELHNNYNLAAYMSALTRAYTQNVTAAFAAEFNDFYHDITLPKVSQIGNYSIIKEIGEGAFGKVYLAQHVLLRTKVVLKCGKLDDPNIVREIFYHRQLKHRNIVKLYEIIKTESHLWMALEYCEGLELFYYICEQRIERDTIRKLFWQIAEAIRHVHLLNLSHRDLKLENILLADKRRTLVKLTDFGFVREFNPNRRQFLSTVCGTTAYMAPEMLKAEKYSGFAVDVWLMGCILYAMAYGELPFEDDDDMQTKWKIVNEQPHFPQPDAELNGLISKMLDKDPSKRPTVLEILNLPFLVDTTNSYQEKRCNDTELIVLINQHYKENKVPFQTKIERDLLKRLDKMNLDTDSLQLLIYAGYTNPLTAFYELCLTREYKKKKYKYKKRRYDAKRQIRRSRKRVRSALSLSDQGQPLEKIISSLSLNLRDTSRMLRKLTDRIPKRRISLSNSVPQTPTSKPETERLVLFIPDDRKSTFSYENVGKGKKILHKLQFWKKKHDDSDDEGLELRVDHSPEEKLQPNLVTEPQRSVSIDTNLPLPADKPRPRPESMVSQVSQLSQLSQVSESELEMLEGTEDEDYDDLYELLINTLQPELQYRLSFRKKRPPHGRSPSDSLIKVKKRLSHVSSDSSDDSEMKGRFIDGDIQRPLSPRLRFNTRQPQFVSKQRSFQAVKPEPVPARGVARSHLPPIMKKFVKGRDSVAENNQDEPRWRFDTPREKTINEEDEEEEWSL